MRERNIEFSKSQDEDNEEGEPFPTKTTFKLSVPIIAHTRDHILEKAARHVHRAWENSSLQNERGEAIQHELKIPRLFKFREQKVRRRIFGGSPCQAANEGFYDHKIKAIGFETDYLDCHLERLSAESNTNLSIRTSEDSITLVSSTESMASRSSFDGNSLYESSSSIYSGASTPRGGVSYVPMANYEDDGIKRSSRLFSRYQAKTKQISRYFGLNKDDNDNDDWLEAPILSISPASRASTFGVPIDCPIEMEKQKRRSSSPLRKSGEWIRRKSKPVDTNSLSVNSSTKSRRRRSISGIFGRKSSTTSEN